MFSCHGSGSTCCIFTRSFNCNGSGVTRWISTWRLNRHVSWIGTCKSLWHMVSIFGWFFTCCTWYLDDWNWRRIFGCIVTGNSAYITTWISKSWICATWYASGGDFWFVVWLWNGQLLVFLPPPCGLPQSYLRGGGGGGGGIFSLPLDLILHLTWDQ